MEEDKFQRDLDELFRLFKKLMEQQSLDDVPGVDPMMIRQFQLLFGNYEQMKDQIRSQLQGQFGEPIKKLVSDLIVQLREQLGEEQWAESEGEVDFIEIKSTDIKAIDELLKNPDLTEDQINELLDKRADLL